MIGVFFVILLPACIIQAIVYRRARKNIHDMPNYTSANGPQYGVTGYPQGTEPPGRSWYTGFSPPWSYKHPCTGRQGTPGSFPANGYGTNPAQGQGYGMDMSGRDMTKCCNTFCTTLLCLSCCGGNMCCFPCGGYYSGGY